MSHQEDDRSVELPRAKAILEQGRNYRVPHSGSSTQVASAELQRASEVVAEHEPDVNEISRLVRHLCEQGLGTSDAVARLSEAFRQRGINLQEIVILLQCLCAHGLSNDDPALTCLYEGRPDDELLKLIKIADGLNVNEPGWEETLELLTFHHPSDGLAEAIAYGEIVEGAEIVTRALGGWRSVAVMYYCCFEMNHSFLESVCTDDAEIFDAINYWLEGDHSEPGNGWQWWLLNCIPKRKKGSEAWYVEQVLRTYRAFFDNVERIDDEHEVEIPFGLLVELGEKAVPMLTEVLKHHDMNAENPEATRYALAVLTQIGPPAAAAVEVVRERLQSMRNEIVKGSKETLASIECSTTNLANHAKAPLEYDRNFAVELLISVGREGVPLFEGDGHEDDDDKLERLRNRVVEIGEALNRQGGIELMRDVYDAAVRSLAKEGIVLGRWLECVWDGIGNWCG